MKGTVLLTGATEFLGSHLLEALLKEHYDVIIAKRSFSDTYRIDSFLPKVRAYNIDVTHLADIFTKNKVSVIIHAATCYGKEYHQTSDILESNIMFPIKLIQCAINNNVKTFINTDTFYDTNYDNLARYALSKKQLVDWLRIYSDKIKIINLKLGHVYGPRDLADKFVPWMLHQILWAKKEVDLTPGKQKRDFIYVSDVVNAYMKVMVSKKIEQSFSSFDVGFGKIITIKEFILQANSAIEAVIHNKPKTIFNFGALIEMVNL